MVKLDWWEDEKVKVLTPLAAWITDIYGERCPDIDEDCPCCKLWKLYDQFAAEID